MTKDQSRFLNIRATQTVRMTKADHKALEDFIGSETNVSLNPPSYEHHIKTNFALCQALKTDNSVYDREAYHNLHKNMKLLYVNNEPELHSHFTYKNDPRITFKAENSNFGPALKAAISTVRKLKNMGGDLKYLKQYEEEV